jgi:hypothetical protein
LGDANKKKLTKNVQKILGSQVISLSVKKKILDTVYLMNQWKSEVKLENKFLCEVSTAVLDSAKALFYMENLFAANPQTNGEPLIEMYAEIEETESAIGLVKVVKNINTKTKLFLNQKLKHYHEALREYDRLEENEKSENVSMQIATRKQMSDW